MSVLELKQESIETKNLMVSSLKSKLKLQKTMIKGKVIINKFTDFQSAVKIL